MAELSDELKREVWRRDNHRCQECGVAVACRNGCMPQTHHVIPKGLGGSDDPANLKTLCLVCHATKDSLNHKKLFLDAHVPTFVKQGLWELSTNTVVFAENLSAMNFPARQVLTYIQSMQDALESFKKSTLLAIEENPHVMENEQPDQPESPETLEEIIRGFRISYWSRHQQLYFDEQVRGEDTDLANATE